MNGGGIVPLNDAIVMLVNARRLLGALDLALKSADLDTDERESLSELTVTIRVLVSEAAGKVNDVTSFVKRVAA